MKNPVLFYVAIAIGIIAVAVGLYLHLGVHPAFNGKAYAIIAVGVLFVIAGIGGMVVAKPKTTVVK